MSSNIFIQSLETVVDHGLVLLDLGKHRDDDRKEPVLRVRIALGEQMLILTDEGDE